jgi:molybdate transport system substrate-binding protein
VELRILAGGAIAVPLSELAAQYEKSSGHKLALRFGTTPVLVGLATNGGPFDLGVVPVDVMHDPTARAMFAAGPTTDIARAGLGIAVRAGAAKPDIATVEALKRTLLDAQSIATIPASAGGTQVSRVFDALGIGEAMKAKIKAQSTPAEVVQATASGEAELGIFLLNVLIAPGLDVVGPISASLHKEVVFTAALSADTKSADASRAFIAFLKSPAAVTLLRARGLTPASTPAS